MVPVSTVAVPIPLDAVITVSPTLPQFSPVMLVRQNPAQRKHVVQVRQETTTLASVSVMSGSTVRMAHSVTVHARAHVQKDLLDVTALFNFHPKI